MSINSRSNMSVISSASTVRSVGSRAQVSPARVDMEFPRTMIEVIDVDKLNKILKHKDVKEEHKAVLRNYKRRLDGNKATVTYDYGKDYKREQLGRVFAKDACGLQLFPKDVRSALAGDHYWDIDVVCCQPTLLAHYCAEHNVVCNTLCEYITNRQAILTDVQQHYGVEYDDAKELFNRTLYLGGENNWKKDNDCATVPTHPFVQKFSDEIWTIARVVCAENPDLRKKINKVKKLPDGDMGFATLGGVMSFTLQTYEHLVLCNMVQFFESVGRSVDALIFDGCLVRKHSGETEFPIELLAECSEYISDHIAIPIQLTVKPLISKLVFNDETLQDFGDVVDDVYATRKFIHLMGEHIKRDCADIYVFNKSNGMWEKGEDAVRSAIVRNADKLVFVEQIGKATVVHNYGGVVTKQNQIIKLLLSVMEDTKFITNNIDTSKGKILFTDGIFDCETGSFSEGFNSDVVFLSRIPRPFPSKRYPITERKVNQSLFVQPFSTTAEDTDPEMGRFYKNALAYAMAGDYTHKKMYVVLGDSNCGKGVITGALQSCFGNYVSTFNGKDLAINRRNGSDSAKQLGWIVDKLHSRMLIANEMEMDRGVTLNGNLVKSLSSGGDSIDVRRNYADPSPVKVTQNVFLFANDCPPITPVDSGIHTRMRYIRFTKSFVDKPLEECGPAELPADPTIKDKVRGEQWANSLFWILYSAYAKIRNQPYWSPECVIAETREFIGSDKVIKEKLEERYEFGTEAEGFTDDDYVPYKEIEDYLNTEGGLNGSWSTNRIGRELTKLGLPVKAVRIGTKPTTVRTRIRQRE